MKREARIIIPTTATAAAAELEQTAVERFGGFTVSYGTGAWKTPDGETETETVAIYDIATEDTPWAVWALWEIARRAAETGNQFCVYLRLPNGDVRFVKPNGECFV